MNNNVIFKLILIAATSLLWLTSCKTNSHTNLNSDNGVKFEKKSFNKTHSLVDNLEHPSCNLNIEVLFPVESARYNLESIQTLFQNSLFGSDSAGLSFDEAIEKYASNYISNYKRDAEIYKTTKPTGEYSSEFEDMFHEDGEHVNLPEIFYSYYESITDTIIYNNYGIISFQITQTNNKGGVVSHENVRNYVINLLTGDFVSEGDIFSAGYDVALRPIIQNCLMQQNGVKSISDLEDLGYFGVDEIIPNRNFMLTDIGIIFTFNKGEYSAYQLPPSEIFIPYSHVRSILRESSIANKISQLK